MKRWNIPIAVYLFLVFVSGAVVGALAYRVYSPPAAKSSAAPRLSPDEWRRQHMEEMRVRVGLSSDQMEKLNAIYDDTGNRFRDARERQNQVVKQIREDHVGRVRAVLTPDQLPKYEELRAEWERAKAANKK